MKHLWIYFFILTGLLGAPKHEFRAAWVATVYRLDWPRSNWSSSAMQNEITQMADSLKNNGFNAIIFQVRPECDAFYQSNYEPWSRHLTGTSGQAPSPFFDPLEKWIEAAHERGMELHAWFNPYRVTTSSNPSSLHSSHVYHQHPEWLLSVGTREDAFSDEVASNTQETEQDLRSSLILDPGMAEVREYVISVFLDVVNNYDVDAVHMDDYFYPYGGMNGEDATTFANEPRGFGDIENWRRDNINLLVAGIHDSIQVVKPWVKYGVSPFGIWKSGYPAGVVGTSSYYELYCDPMAWLGAGTIDYLTPQLYWEHGGGQDYGSLMPWWADSVAAHGRHFYPGLAPYRMSDWHDWPVTEMTRQVRSNQNSPQVQGSVFFRLRSGIVNNPKHFLDSLDNNYYQYPALIPSMPWIDDVPPNPPSDLALNDNQLSWLAPLLATDGDSAYQYVIYGTHEAILDPEDGANILRVIPATQTSTIANMGMNTFGLSSLDRIGNESEVTILQPTEIEAERPTSSRAVNAFPNPFNPTTVIQFDLDESLTSFIDIYDLNGRRVASIHSGGMSEGEVMWNGKDEFGQPLPSGVYFCRLGTQSSAINIKLMLLR